MEIIYGYEVGEPDQIPDTVVLRAERLYGDTLSMTLPRWCHRPPLHLRLFVRGSLRSLQSLRSCRHICASLDPINDQSIHQVNFSAEKFDLQELPQDILENFLATVSISGPTMKTITVYLLCPVFPVIFWSLTSPFLSDYLSSRPPVWLPAPP